MADKTKSTNRSQMTESKAQSSEKEQSKSKSRSVARSRWSTNRSIRFIRDAYYEVRHKVTWPTLEEARNMTMIVIALSAAMAVLLGAADLGLFQIFRLINGAK